MSTDSVFTQFLGDEEPTPVTMPLPSMPHLNPEEDGVALKMLAEVLDRSNRQIVSLANRLIVVIAAMLVLLAIVVVALVVSLLVP
jgi:hypothetical protein